MFRSPALPVMRAQQCDPAGGYAHRFMRTVTPYSARWPDHLRVGNAAHAHIKGLTRRSRGLRANRGVRAHIQGLACEWTARLRLQTLRPRDHRTRTRAVDPRNCPKTQTTSPAAANFRPVLPRWSALWAHLPPFVRHAGKEQHENNDAPAKRRHGAPHATPDDRATQRSAHDLDHCQRGRGTPQVAPASSFKHNVWLISIEVPHRLLSRRLASPLQHVRHAPFSRR